MGADLIKEVRHELVMLPYYGVFDNLTYRVDGSKVTLLGEVRQPQLKSDAEKAVKSIEGVTTVENEIEVLPLSASDDSIRRAVYRAVYSQSALERYQMSSVPPIHILVKNGDVTLEGVVATEGDKDIAGIASNGAGGVHRVVNNIRLDK
jgi:hyperosmotically inducible protein